MACFQWKFLGTAAPQGGGKEKHEGEETPEAAGGGDFAPDRAEARETGSNPLCDLSQGCL